MPDRVVAGTDGALADILDPSAATWSPRRWPRIPHRLGAAEAALFQVAVGIPVARHPPHRSVLALL